MTKHDCKCGPGMNRRHHWSYPPGAITRRFTSDRFARQPVWLHWWKGDPWWMDELAHGCDDLDRIELGARAAYAFGGFVIIGTATI